MKKGDSYICDSDKGFVVVVVYNDDESDKDRTSHTSNYN